MALFGSYYVKPTNGACVDAWRLCRGRMRDYQRIRSYALQLAFWPDGAGLDWDWIKSFESKRIGELRIHKTIAQCNNLRVIFFKANKILPTDPLPRIWILTVFQKKRQQFSRKEIAAFRVMRDIVVARWYGDLPGA